MKHSVLPSLGLAIVGLAQPVFADSTEAYCKLSRHDHTIAVEQGPCLFSQRQGNATVQMGQRWAFRFNADDQSKSYQRSSSEQGIRFTREGQYTLSVFWAKPAR